MIEPVKHDWPKIIRSLRAEGLSWYYIAKECGIFAYGLPNGKKIKRWSEGKSKPDADEAPDVLRLYESMIHMKLESR